jgi:aerobic-type carbon monoxide dehydrogenase small subunit (CoxS/CutS family)
MDAEFLINGKTIRADFAADITLLDLLRREGYTEVKAGCHMGQCGACVVLLEGRPVNSCQVFAASAAGKAITTVAGLGSVHDPHPIQQAFVEAGAVQCGFCTPGMILVTAALLAENSAPGEAEIKRALDGNLCRCTGYVKIIAAVRLAAERMADHG